MRSRHGYDPAYQGGKCPYGYEYVEAFRRDDGTWVDSYCRKLPKKRFRFTDPESQELSKPPRFL